MPWTTCSGELAERVPAVSAGCGGPENRLRQPGHIDCFPAIMKPLASIVAMFLTIATAVAATDLWDLPPLRYSETASHDPIAKLAEALAKGERKVEGTTPLEKLRFVLKLLEIPEESQILVFSKTSKQNSLIHPANPRCLFFNENSYVGYVPGGDMEVITHDPALGSVYYLIGTHEPALQITRDNSDCLSCHGTARTELIPGVLVRSVFPDEAGQPLLSLGTFLTDNSSPIPERWGGYYVTGRSSLPHLGNRTYKESDGRELPRDSPELTTLAGRIDISRYPRATSDIVSLMVLEHQCQLHNQLIAAGMNYRRIHWLQKSLNPAADPDADMAGKHADDAARKIVDLLLFENEADPGENGVEGDPAFQDAFTRSFPKSRDGRSLADFQLGTRLFKHRCSYMIYSKAFDALPARIKSAVIARLHRVLESEPAAGNHPAIKASERHRIAAILQETLPAWSAK